MARPDPPRKVTYFEPVPPRLARNTIIESTFEVGRRFRCTMRIDCGQIDPSAVIRPIPGEWRVEGGPNSGHSAATGCSVNIVDHCCYAWNKLVAQPWIIMSIGFREWAYGF